VLLLQPSHSGSRRGTRTSRENDSPARNEPRSSSEFGTFRAAPESRWHCRLLPCRSGCCRPLRRR
jgi:hypothetical protein